MSKVFYIDSRRLKDGASPGGGSGVLFECDESAWINQERKNFPWYVATYPQLRNFNLPLSMDYLRFFYINDMEERNLDPNPTYLSCYAFLWSHFLGRITNQISFEGRSWWELTKQNFPGAVKKTIFKDIPGLLFELPPIVWIIAGVYIADKIGLFD